MLGRRYSDGDVHDVHHRLDRYFILDDKFASGCFGKIMLARDLSEKEVVIKQIPKESSCVLEVRKEVDAGNRLKHPNVSNFIEYFENENNHYLVLDRVHGSDLFSIIEKRKFVPFSDSEARSMFKQILKAMQYCHKQGIVHRDIKLENILRGSDGHITLIDFGLCDTVNEGDLSERFCGSMDYVAPEVLSRKTYDAYVSDMFSLGIVLYALLFAEFPFVAKDRVKAIRAGLTMPKPKFCDQKMKKWNVDPDAKDLILKLLTQDPLERLTLMDAKFHPWMRKEHHRKAPISQLSQSTSG